MEKGKKEKRKAIAREAKSLGLITAGCAIFALAFGMMLDAWDIVPGGVSGLALVINRLIPIKTGTLYLLLNIPILILGERKFGFRFMIKTIYAVALSSFLTNFFASFGPICDQKILAAVMGGLLEGIGIGLILKTGATTGGTDIIARVIKLKMPHLHIGTLLMTIDFIPVLLSGIVFRDVNACVYSVICVFACSKLIDMMLYGSNEARFIYIITENPKCISDAIVHELGIGCTLTTGIGAWSGKEKPILLCATHKRLTPKIKEIVKAADPAAFMILLSATNIYGEGYQNINDTEI